MIFTCQKKPRPVVLENIPPSRFIWLFPYDSVQLNIFYNSPGWLPHSRVCTVRLSLLMGSLVPGGWPPHHFIKGTISQYTIGGMILGAAMNILSPASAFSIHWQIAWISFHTGNFKVVIFQFCQAICVYCILLKRRTHCPSSPSLVSCGSCNKLPETRWL